MPAYAVEITKENMSAIASEGGPGFVKQRAMDWLEEHGEGYFLRNPGDALDCQFFEPVVFFELYKFEYPDNDMLFRRVVKI